MSKVYNVKAKKMSLVSVNNNGGMGGGCYKILTKETLESLTEKFSANKFQIIKSSITNNPTMVNGDWISTIQTVYVSEFDNTYFYTRDENNCKCVDLEYTNRPKDGWKWFKYEGL